MSNGDDHEAASFKDNDLESPLTQIRQDMIGAPSLAGDDVSLVELWGHFVRYRKSFLVVVGIATIMSVIYALLADPIYRSEVLLAPVSEQEQRGLAALAGQFGGLATLAGINIGVETETTEAIAILHSRSFTTSFIEDEKLMPILFSNKWDGENNRWNVRNAEDIPTNSDDILDAGDTDSVSGCDRRCSN